MYTRIYVEITNMCNMHCSFCHGHHRKQGQMNREEFARILQEAEGKTQYIYYHLMGEPLTHPLLPEFLKMAAEKGFRSVITTNGTLLHKRGEELLAAGVHKFNISLHSFEQNDAAGQRAYLQQVATFADAAAKAGTLVSMRLWNKDADEGRNVGTLAFLQDYFPENWKENSRGFRIRDKIYLEWGDRFQWPDMDAADGGENVFCYGMQDHFGILCDGTVVPCCLDSEGAISLGNVFTQSLEQILHSPRATAIAEGFRQRKAPESLCRRCGYARRFG